MVIVLQSRLCLKKKEIPLGISNPCGFFFAQNSLWLLHYCIAVLITTRSVVERFLV